MITSDESINYGAKLIRARPGFSVINEYINGPLALKSVVSLLYGYSGKSLNVEFYDNCSNRMLLCSVKLDRYNAVVIHGKSVDDFVMTHPWDVGCRIEHVLRGWLNISCLMSGLDEVLKA